MTLYELEFQFAAWPKITIYVVSDPQDGLDRIERLGRTCIREHRDMWPTTDSDIVAKAALLALRRVTDLVVAAPVAPPPPPPPRKYPIPEPHTTDGIRSGHGVTAADEYGSLG